MTEVAYRSADASPGENPVSADGMAPGLPLLTNVAWTFMGHVVYAACQWGTVTVLARLGTPEMVGEFALALAITAPVFMLAGLQLGSVLVTDANHTYSFGDYLGLRLVTMLLALLATAGISIATGYEAQTIVVILAVGVGKAFESISGVFHSLLQRHERMDRIAISTMIKGPLSLAALGTAVYLSGSLLWGALGLATVRGAMLVGYDILSAALLLKAVRQLRNPVSNTMNVRAELRPQFDFRTLAQLAWLALPLGLTMMLISLNRSIAQYIVERFLGRGELGLFAAMAYIIVVGNLVVGALGQSAAPRLARYYGQGDGAAFRKLLTRLIMVGVALGGAFVLAALAAGEQILALVYGPEYARHLDAFIWLMVAAAIYYVASFMGYGMTAARYFRVQMPLFALVAATSGLACLWLAPSYGLRGAAMARVVTAMVQAAGGIAVIAHALRSIRKMAKGELELDNQDRH